MNIFKSQIKKAQIKVIKVDKDNNEIKLEGVIFDVLDQDGNIVQTLKTDKNGTPRFDFAIMDTHNNVYCLIEYDGRQHFHYDKNWKMSKKDY